MNTLAQLIRRHEQGDRTLYLPQTSERESAPGQYERTARQRSPALERRETREAARDMALDRFPGISPEDLEAIDDWEDLQDYIDGTLDPPAVPDTTPPEVPLPTTPSPPEFPTLTPVNPPATLDVLTVLMDGRIAHSTDGGATWREYTTSPAAPVGLSAGGGAVVVATATELSESSDFAAWTTIPLVGYEGEEIPIINGDFEGGSTISQAIAGWDYVSGDSPRVRSTQSPPQKEGSTHYLTRDWVIAGTGNFEIAQNVDLTQWQGGNVELSADLWVESNASAVISLEVQSPGELALLGGVSSVSQMDAGESTTVNSPVACDNALLTLESEQTTGFFSVFGNRVSWNWPLGFAWGLWRWDFRDASNDPVAVSGRTRFELVADERVDVVETDGTTSWEITSGPGTISNGGARVNATGNTEAVLTVSNATFLRLRIRQQADGDRSPGFLYIYGQPQGVSTIAAVSESTDGAWHRPSSTGTIPSNATTATLRISATGTPADAYIDNVGLTAETPIGVADIRAIAPRPNGGTSLIEDDRILRYKGSKLTTDRGVQPSVSLLSHDIFGQAFAANALGIEAPSGRIIGTNLPDPIQSLVGGTEKLIAIGQSGAVREYEDSEERTVTQLGTVTPYSGVAWSGFLGGFIVVEPDGDTLFTEDNFQTFTTLPTLSLDGAYAEIRVSTGPSGVIYAWHPQWSNVAYLAPNSGAWAITGNFNALIADFAAR